MLYFVWGTWWYYWNYLPNHHFFFQNGCHFAKMSTLSDFNENWYLGVIWRGEHDGTIEILFRATIFFSKWPPYCKNFNFVRFQWKLISWGILMWRTWWYHSSLVPSHHFFFKWLPYRQNFNFVWFQWKLISWGLLMWRTWWYHGNFVPSHNFFSKWPPYRKNFNFVRFQWKLISCGILMWRPWWYYGFFFRNCHHIA